MRRPSLVRWVRTSVIGGLLIILIGLWFVPLDMAANEEALTFPSGHTITNAQGFLTHWQGMGGEALLGQPISQPLIENGLPVQYFERGRLEQHIELDGSPIMLGRIGAEYAEALWRTFEPGSTEAPVGARRFDITGYTLQEPFLGFWERHGNMAMFGYPISEPLWEYVGNQMLQVQYFERGRLEYDALAAGTSDEVRISPLGRDLALLRGLDLTPASPPAPPPTAAPLPVEAPAGPPTAAPAAAPAAPAAPAAAAPAAKPARPMTGEAVRKRGKYIVVDLGDQWLYAYEGDRIVFDAPVSTGKDGFNTPPGNFAVYAKLRSQTMEGTLGGEYYRVPNVPHVMYINGGVAIHGTYWHNQFGTGVRRSHGCINLPLKSAAWLYEWSPMGTPVTVRW